MNPPVPFDSKALGEHVLGRLAEIEHLKSPEHRREVTALHGRYFGYCADEDKERIEVLSQHLDIYAQLTTAATQTEHNAVLAAQQNTPTRRRSATDEF